MIEDILQKATIFIASATMYAGCLSPLDCDQIVTTMDGTFKIYKSKNEIDAMESRIFPDIFYSGNIIYRDIGANGSLDIVELNGQKIFPTKEERDVYKKIYE